MEIKWNPQPGFIRRSVYRVGDTPALPAKSIAEEMFKLQQQAKQQSRTKMKKLGLFICVAAVAFGSCALLFSVWNKPAAPRAQATTASNTFVSYTLPSQMDDFTVDAPTYSRMDNSVTYALTHRDGQKLFISQQPKPTVPPVELLANNDYTEITPATSKLGEAFITSASGRTTGSILTDTTWILISNTQVIDQSIMADAIKLFDAANRAAEVR